MFTRAIAQYEAMKKFEPIQAMFEYFWFFGDKQLKGCSGSPFELFLMSHLVLQSMVLNSSDYDIWKHYERDTGRKGLTYEELVALHHELCGVDQGFYPVGYYAFAYDIHHGPHSTLLQKMVEFYHASARCIKPSMDSPMEIFLMSVAMINWFVDEGDWDRYEAATGHEHVLSSDLLALQDELSVHVGSERGVSHRDQEV